MNIINNFDKFGFREIRNSDEIPKAKFHQNRYEEQQLSATMLQNYVSCSTSFNQFPPKSCKVVCQPLVHANQNMQRRHREGVRPRSKDDGAVADGHAVNGDDAERGERALVELMRRGSLLFVLNER